MKVAAMFGDGAAGLVDRPDPRPRDQFVLVEVRAVPMCTEYKAFKVGQQGDAFGHEAAGVVVEVAQPGRVAVGDRVVAMPLHGNWHYNLADTPQVMRPIGEAADLLDRAVTHTFPMHRVQEAWELQVRGECGKVVLHPWE